MDSAEDNDEYTIEPMPTPDARIEVAVRALIAAVASGAGPFGAAAAQLSTRPLSSLLQGAINEWTAHSFRQAERALSVASAEANLALDALFAALTRDGKRLLLLRDALQAAADTAVEAKLRVLGRALASGALATDDALIDDERMIVRTVSELESPHLQLLARISQGGPRLPHPGQQREISERQLGSARLEKSEQRSLLQPLLHILSRNGLIRQTGAGITWGQEPDDEQSDKTTRWAVTSFGADVLRRLRDAGSDDQSESEPD